jgi:hypothetical protein
MKTFYFLLLFFSCFIGVAQNTILINNTFSEFENTIPDTITYNKLTLNSLFSLALDGYVISNETPSARKFSAVINSDDNSLSIGYNFDFRKKNSTSYIKNLFYFGIKNKNKKEKSFFAFFDKDNSGVKNIGLDFKYTFLFSGGITPKDDSKSKIKKYRNDKVKALINDEYGDKDSDKIKSSEINSFIAGEEAKYILKNNEFKEFVKYWINLGLYIPLTNDEYNVTEVNMYKPIVTSFNNWDFNISGNVLKKIRDMSGTLTLGYKFFNNNNIQSGSIKNKEFVTLVQLNNGYSLSETDKAYQGTYNEFTTHQIKGEITSLLYKETIGLSGAIEQNFGQDGSLNWKLGVPLSLKDSDGGSSVNFEIQWREFNGDHFIGISIGKSFGKFIN